MFGNCILSASLYSSDNTSKNPKNPSTLLFADLYRRLPKVDIVHSSFSGRGEPSGHVNSISDALDNLVGLVVRSMQPFENS